MRALLQSAGFTVQGNRASCVHCNGTARLTVSFTADVAFCHRCKWAQNKVQLARGLGRTVHAEESTHRRARLRVEAFRKWLSAKYSELANRERRLARRAEWAKVALEDLFSNRWPGVIGFCWWNEGWQNDDNKKHDTDMIILHDRDLTRVFRDEFARHADKIQETPIEMTKSE